MVLRKQAGDTIVEVLIAIAVLSLVLGGAYAIANRTLANSRQAQEHGEAQHLASTQLELISKYISEASEEGSELDLTALTIGAAAKCVTETLSVQVTPCTAHGPIPYKTSFEHIGSAPNDHFRVKVEWEGATGSATKDKIELVYRPYYP